MSAWWRKAPDLWLTRNTQDPIGGDMLGIGGMMKFHCWWLTPVLGQSFTLVPFVTLPQSRSRTMEGLRRLWIEKHSLHADHQISPLPDETK